MANILHGKLFWLVVIFLLGYQKSSAFGASGKNEDGEESDIPLGSLVKRGTYPYTAAILRDGRQICGGTLIDSKHILTAANCVAYLDKKDIRKLKVQLNTVALKSFNPGLIDSYVSAFKAHEKYNKVTHENDIGLIRLETSVDTLYPVTLNTEINDNLEGKSATILRWGSGSVAGKDSNNKVLLQASVVAISNQACAASYDVPHIFNTSLCASSKSKEELVCLDDSAGGPLIIDGQQVGVASWTKGCMDSKYPGVYIRVAAYKDWISFSLASL